MAQNFPTSPLVIYNTLTGDPTFSSYIGTYTFADGSTTPSIVINTPGTDLPQVEEQAGLEVIIHDVADMGTMDYITSPSEPVFQWQLFLVVWAPATGDVMTDALRRLVELFPGASSLDTVTTGTLLGSSVQTQVIIPSNTLIA